MSLKRDPNSTFRLVPLSDKSEILCTYSVKACSYLHASTVQPQFAARTIFGSYFRVLERQGWRLRTVEKLKYVQLWNFLADCGCVYPIAWKNEAALSA